MQSPAVKDVLFANFAQFLSKYRVNPEQRKPNSPTTPQQHHFTSMTSDEARSALALLFENERKRDVVLNRRSADSVEDDDDADREWPAFDKYYDKYINKWIAKLINFTAMEFRGLYAKLHEEALTKWNFGSGRKFKHTSIDVFFMLLAVLNHGGSWDILA